jgi:hypothetical protein
MIFMPSLAFFFLGFFLLTAPVKAEELVEVTSEPTVQATETADPNLKTNIIWERERLDQEIATVKATYQSQLESYLYQDKLYRIAYDQRKQLQTLASIEDLIQKAKTLGIARDDVLISYLDLLRLNLITTEGIELSLKAEYLTRLETTIVYIKNHQENLKNLNNKEQVALSLSAFTTDQKDIEKLADGVLVLLSVGNLQIIYDKAVVLKADIDAYLGQKGTLNLPAISRASIETNRSLDAAKLKLDTFWTDALDHGGGSGHLASLYSNLPSEMNPVYVNLSQSISYLGELLSI